MRHLLTDNHEDRARPAPAHPPGDRDLPGAAGRRRGRAAADPDADGRAVRLTVDLQLDFALNQPLSPFALAASSCSTASRRPTPLDVVSVIESTLDDPRQVLSAQQFKARGEAVAAMKAEGIEYEAADGAARGRHLPEAAGRAAGGARTRLYRRGHPWVADHELSPKSVVRDMYERAMTFTEYVASTAWPAPRAWCCATSPTRTRRCARPCRRRPSTEELADLIEWLGELVRQVDSSLLDEWEQLRNPGADDRAEARSTTSRRRSPATRARSGCWSATRCSAGSSWPRCAAATSWASWTARPAGTPTPGPRRWTPYFDEYDEIGTGPDARGPALLHDRRRARTAWTVRQILDDPDGDHDWGISAEVDLAASDEVGAAVVRDHRRRPPLAPAAPHPPRAVSRRSWTYRGELISACPDSRTARRSSP